MKKLFFVTVSFLLIGLGVQASPLTFQVKYVDQTGLEWSQNAGLVFGDLNGPADFKAPGAVCKSMNALLPTLDQYLNMLTEFAHTSAGANFVFLTEGSEKFSRVFDETHAGTSPRLESSWFWTSSADNRPHEPPSLKVISFAKDFSSFALGRATVEDIKMSVRCVRSSSKFRK